MKNLSLFVMAVLYIAAGLNHFINPVVYEKILPPRIPYPNLVVAFSGACEILLALLLLPPITRPFSAWAIILFLIFVFPANLQMTINYYRTGKPWLWLTILRLPLQAFLIYWAYTFTKD